MPAPSMDVAQIPVISVSYNSAELIEDLLASLRTHYRNPVTIIDGSDAQHYRAIEAVCARHADVRFIHFDYNIHHGPGMAWAFQHLGLSGPALVLDSDICVLHAGFLEAMAAALQPGMYGVGYVNHVNEGGFDVDYEQGAIRYLHPACMLVDLDVVRQWPMPTKHGAPMTEPMRALHRADRGELIAGLGWLKEDFLSDSADGARHYLRHDWQGTVKRSGGYHLDEWSAAAQQAGEVGQLLHALLPPGARTLIELGDNDGMLARRFKEADPARRYVAVGGHPDRRSLRPGGADAVQARALDTLDDAFFRDHADTDCWLLDQALEHCAAPALLLARLRKAIRADASVLAVVPNAQHWGMQLRLCVGDLRYADTGLLSPSQRRWFSRATLFELFQQAGFRIEQGVPLVRHRLRNPPLEALLRQLAASMGADPDTAFEDAQATLYVVRAVPN